MQLLLKKAGGKKKEELSCHPALCVRASSIEGDEMGCLQVRLSMKVL